MGFQKTRGKAVSTVGNPEGTITEAHHNTYRILCVLTVVLSPLFGIVYHYTDPTAFDPLWSRVLLSVPFLAIFLLSYTSSWVLEHLISLVHGFFYLVVPFFVVLTALNNYAPNYTIGSLFVLTATGVAVSLGVRTLRPLVYFLGYGALVTVLGILTVPEPEVSYSLLLISSVSTVFVIFVVAQSKIRAEDIMRQTAHRYQTLMNSANDAIFIADRDDNMLVDANEKAQELIGRSLDEIRRMRPRELFPEDQVEAYMSLLSNHVEQGTPVGTDLYVEHRDGRVIPVDVSASLVEVGGRELVQSIFRDVTDRHRYQARLIEAKEQAEEHLRLKNSLLNNMSHDLRTPLAGILGYSELLTKQGSEKQRRFAERIAHSAESLQQTLNSVLDLAELEAGRTVVADEEVDIVSEVQKVAEMHEQLAEKKGLELRVVALQEEITARVDQSCLRRSLANLISNAIKFTDEGHVKAVIEGTGPTVEIRIVDTGIGIDEDFLPHVFEEFRQESGGLSRNYEGSGLGLALTQRMVEMMGGHISVRSEKNVGSVFKVVLPRELPDQEEPSEQTGESPRTQVERSDRKRVLILEDNPHMRGLMQEQLNDEYEIVATSSPDTAIQAAKSKPFDALLLDINLGRERSGVDVLRTIRLTPNHAKTPAAAVTAYAMLDDRKYFLSAGFDFYLSKPFSSNQLRKTVRKMLGTSSDVAVENVSY